MPPNVSRLPRPRRLLLSRPDRLGDVIITTSCLQELRRQLPKTQLYFAVRAPYAFMLEGNPHLDGLLRLEENIEPTTMAETLRALELDAIVHLNPEPKLEQAAALADIPCRIGYSRKRGQHLNAWLPYKWKKAGVHHEAYYNFDLLELFDIQAPENLLPKISIPAEEKKWAQEQLGGQITALIHLASYGNKPRGPASFFAAIAKRLHQEQGIRLAIVGASGEDASVKTFLHEMGPLAASLQNYAGQTTVAQLAGLCQAAHLMISRDSGPAHLAAAVHCPTLTFFLNPKPLMSPRRWAPLGRSVRIYTKPILTLPYEPPHRLARRTILKFDANEAYQEALSLMKIYSVNKQQLR